MLVLLVIPNSLNLCLLLCLYLLNLALKMSMEIPLPLSGLFSLLISTWSVLLCRLLPSLFLTGIELWLEGDPDHLFLEFLLLILSLFFFLSLLDLLSLSIELFKSGSRCSTSTILKFASLSLLEKLDCTFRECWLEW